MAFYTRDVVPSSVESVQIIGQLSYIPDLDSGMDAKLHRILEVVVVCQQILIT